MHTFGFEFQILNMPILSDDIGVVQSSQSAINCNRIRISCRNLHKILPCELLKEIWYTGCLKI